MNIQSALEKDVNSILSHPFIISLSNNEYTKKDLKIFAEQYYLVSIVFIELLLLGSIRIKEDENRSVFIENLFDEHGRGNSKVNHRELLKRFLIALGCGDVKSIVPLEKTSVYIHGMRDLCSRGSQLEVLGALGPGSESFVVEQYKLINTALNKNYDFKKNELIFFASHIAHDPHHTDDIDKVINSLIESGGNYREVISGAKQSIILEKLLWDGIYEEYTRLKN
jgi:pyrroloquinoline quinone (PQQ) biosynthesis protein C